MSFKTPSKIQVEAIECGAVSYWIINGFYNNWITSEEARLDVNVTKDGSNAYNIVQALKRKGFDSDGFQPTIAELKTNKPDCGLPCIAWVNKVHWVVLERFDGTNFLISDPAKGHRKATPEDFEKEYSGLTLSASPTTSFKAQGTKPNAIVDLISIVSSNKRAIALYVILGLILTIPVVSLSSFIGFFTDTILAESQASNSYIWLLTFIVGVFFLSKFLEQLILRRLHLSVLASLVQKTITKLLSLPLSFYPLRDLGEISQRITLNISLSNILTGPLSKASVGLATMAIYAVIMLTYSPTLGILVVLLGAINFYTLISLAKSLSQFSQKSSMMTGKMTSNILYMANNFQFLKANGLELPLFQQWSDNFSQSQSTSEQMSYIQKRNTSTTSFLNQLADYLIVIVSGLFIMMGKISLGEFISFRLISLAFLKPINTLAGVNSKFATAVGDVNRLKDLWDEKDDTVVRNSYQMIDQSSFELDSASAFELISNSTIDLSNGSFRYTPGSPNVFDGVSLKVRHGDVISLSGPPGSGKTTLLQSLSYLTALDSGEITLSGTPISAYAPALLRNTLCFTAQDKYIFTASALENIKVFDPQISQSNILDTIHLYELDSILTSLPQGLATELGPSVQISNSDKVIIHLLRSLVRNPRILIIDDLLTDIDSKFAQQLLLRITQNIPIVIFVSLDPSLLSIASRSLLLNKEGLQEISPPNLIKRIKERQQSKKQNPVKSEEASK